MEFIESKRFTDGLKYYQNLIAHTQDRTIVSWYNIFTKLVTFSLSITPINDAEDVICFVADSLRCQWTGRDYHNKGLGGAETYIVEMATHLCRLSGMTVVVFCRCPEPDTYLGVRYIPIDEFSVYLAENRIRYCIISRYSEYIPLAYQGKIDSLYLVVHDVTTSGNVLIAHPGVLKRVFCVSDWHRDYFLSEFPDLRSITSYLYNGFEPSLFTEPKKKQPFRFIYSSEPVRGLGHLLDMWPSIRKKKPDAELHVYGKTEGIKIGMSGVFLHGFVDKKTLAEAWKVSDIWLYPCVFQETFCCTALEAAVSKTLVIVSDRGALPEIVGDRGIVIRGDPGTKEWKTEALETMFRVYPYKEYYTGKNYRWGSRLTWENQAREFWNQIRE
jgi:glycosyltransferase involved in cell wall biosynthesis